MPASKSIGQITKCEDAAFVDFLRQCLVWEPEKRLSPEAALKHRWITRASSAASRLDNGSVSTKSSTEGNQTKLQAYYATHTKPKAEKAVLNQTAKNETQKTVNITIGQDGQLQMSPANSNAKGKEGHTQDKLFQLKEKLKLVTTKQNTTTIKYSTNPAKHAEAQSKDKKKGLLLHVFSKKNTAAKLTTKPKQRFKQSNIF